MLNDMIDIREYVWMMIRRAAPHFRWVVLHNDTIRGYRKIRGYWVGFSVMEATAYLFTGKQPTMDYNRPATLLRIDQQVFEEFDTASNAIGMLGLRSRLLKILDPQYPTGSVLK